MIANHPITGKEIKILKTEAHLYKNQKTILWLREPTYEFSERLNRWDTITFGHELANIWKPSSVIIREPTEKALEWILTSAPKRYNLLFFSKKVLESIGIEKAKALGFSNIICLEELGEIYPHLLRAYNDEDSDVDVFLMIATLFRASRALGLLENELTNPNIEIYKNRYNLQVGLHQVPEPLWLIQQYYVPPQSKRAKEIKQCLDKNLENPLIDKIILLNEKQLDLPKNPKLEQVVIGHRMKYSDVFEYIQTLPDVLVAFANSDIYLTDTFRNLWSVNLKDVFVSLLRYEPNGELYGPRPDSQDTWVLRADSVKQRKWDLSSLDFIFGKAGCDNAINVELLKNKFLVVNPCLTLKTMHLHSSDIRSYNPLDCIEKPFYLYLEPTGLHDLEPVQDPKVTKIESEPFTCIVNCENERSLKTFCTMASRNNTIQLSPLSENVQSPGPEEVYTFKDSFMTPNSLVYGYKSMILTRNETMRSMWVPEVISHMTPCIGVKSVVAIPSSEDIFTDHMKYVRKYLSRALRLRDSVKADFWLPRNNLNMHVWLQLFNWDEKAFPVLPRDTDVATFAEDIIMTTPRETVHKEDIEALRRTFKPYSLEPDEVTKKRVVIIQDDVILTTQIVEVLEKTLEANNYIVDIIFSKRSAPSVLAELVGANVCICGPSTGDLFWLLPKGCRVIDCMAETLVDGEQAIMAGACSLDYWVLLLPRGRPEVLARLCAEKVIKSLTKSSQVISKKPKIIMPINQEGFHSHKGDSFREMVILWEEMGYVTIERSPETPYVWFNSIGDTLLYDRANYSWIEETRLQYNKILCGNPDAANVQKGIQWSFWPRNPRIVEELASTLLTTDRTRSLVFYGGAENAVQKKHRNNKLHEACDDYSLTDGQTYKFGPREYLYALAQSRFGLCLAGYGPKCNREIECMAVGTVPLVAPDVDMVKYAVPPQEGIHYLRLKTFEPEEARQVIKISEDQWKTMSEAAHQWWKENSSAEGLWALTKSLV